MVVTPKMQLIEKAFLPNGQSTNWTELVNSYTNWRLPRCHWIFDRPSKWLDKSPCQQVIIDSLGHWDGWEMILLDIEVRFVRVGERCGQQMFTLAGSCTQLPSRKTRWTLSQIGNWSSNPHLGGLMFGGEVSHEGSCFQEWDYVITKLFVTCHSLSWWSVCFKSMHSVDKWNGESFRLMMIAMVHKWSVNA